MNFHAPSRPPRPPSRPRRPGLPLAVASIALAASVSACSSQLICASGEVVISGRCVSLQTDPNNCGAPGRACGAGESCSAGLCCLGTQCPPAVYAACFNTDSIQGATTEAVPVGAPFHMESSGAGPIAFAWSGTALWVANSMSNTLDRLTVTPTGLAAAGALPSVTVPVTGPFPDLEAMAEQDGILYVANAAVGSLLIVDPSKSSPVVAEVSLGDATSYPQGVAVLGSKAYVTLRGTDEIVIVDLPTRSVAKRLSVASMASPGGTAMPGRIVLGMDRAYVALWNLDAVTNPYVWTPAGNGRLAVVDTLNDTLAQTAPVDLGASCLNPGGLSVQGITLWVACGFQKFDASVPQPFQGASFVPVDVSGPTPLVGAAVPAGDHGPGSIAFCNGVGYAGDRYSGNMLRLDPVGRTVLDATAVCPPSAYGYAMVADVTCGK